MLTGGWWGGVKFNPTLFFMLTITSIFYIKTFGVKAKITSNNNAQSIYKTPLAA